MRIWIIEKVTDDTANMIAFCCTQVVEIVDRYDNDCVPEDYKNKLLEFIQNGDTNKTCTKKFTVSSLISLFMILFRGIWTFVFFSFPFNRKKNYFC